MSILRNFEWWQLVLLVLITGCNNPETGTVPASGVVTYAGALVEGAEVAFIPQDTASDARPARGTTGSRGEFTINTYFNSKVDARGARPGQYTVTIRKLAAPEGMTIDEWQMASFNDPSSVPSLRSLVPEKYSNMDASGLSATIEKDGENRFKFELRD